MARVEKACVVYIHGEREKRKEISSRGGTAGQAKKALADNAKLLKLLEQDEG